MGDYVQYKSPNLPFSDLVLVLIIAHLAPCYLIWLEMGRVGTASGAAQGWGRVAFVISV
jgi:hypothetical protein